MAKSPKKKPKKTPRIPAQTDPTLNPLAPGVPSVHGRAKAPKVREDLNQLAARIVMEATGQTPKTPDPEAGKDPAAVSLGRRGGLKGGPARAKKLSKKKLSASARKAAQARWGKGRKKNR